MGNLIPPGMVENALAGWVQRELNDQPWWKEKSNTVTTAITGFLGAGAAVTSLGLDLPKPVTATIAVVSFIATLIGVNNTKNGITANTGGQLAKAAADPAVMVALETQLVGYLDAQQKLGNLGPSPTAVTAERPPVTAPTAAPTDSFTEGGQPYWTQRGS